MIVPIPVTTVQVNQDNSLFVTTGVDYDNNQTLVGSEITAQYTLYPGDSLEGQPAEVVKIANALWTPAVVEAYKLANPPVVSLPLPWVAPAPPAMIVPPMLPQVEPVLVNTETPVAAVDEQAPVAEAPAA
jgi:hypothetical protein